MQHICAVVECTGVVYGNTIGEAESHSLNIPKKKTPNPLTVYRSAPLLRNRAFT